MEKVNAKKIDLTHMMDDYSEDKKKAQIQIYGEEGV